MTHTAFRGIALRKILVIGQKSTRRTFCDTRSATAVPNRIRCDTRRTRRTFCDGRRTFCDTRPSGWHLGLAVGPLTLMHFLLSRKHPGGGGLHALGPVRCANGALNPRPEYAKSARMGFVICFGGHSASQQGGFVVLFEKWSMSRSSQPIREVMPQMLSLQPRRLE